MSKRNKVLYWIATVFLSIGMTAGGVQQLLQIGGYNKIVTSLGYPLYLLSIIGAWKLLGVIAILIPKFPLLKEWAYAGFVFVLSGAIISHLAVGQSIADCIPALVLLLATIASWHFRPANRKVNIETTNDDKSKSRLVFQ